MYESRRRTLKCMERASGTDHLSIGPWQAQKSEPLCRGVSALVPLVLRALNKTELLLTTMERTDCRWCYRTSSSRAWSTSCRRGHSELIVGQRASCTIVHINALEARVVVCSHLHCRTHVRSSLFTVSTSFSLSREEAGRLLTRFHSSSHHITIICFKFRPLSCNVLQPRKYITRWVVFFLGKTAAKTHIVLTSRKYGIATIWYTPILHHRQ